jgi:hypothetical protein
MRRVALVLWCVVSTALTTPTHNFVATVLTPHVDGRPGDTLALQR